jgi:hypothetical protein
MPAQPVVVLDDFFFLVVVVVDFFFVCCLMQRAIAFLCMVPVPNRASNLVAPSFFLSAAQVDFALVWCELAASAVAGVIARTTVVAIAATLVGVTMRPSFGRLPSAPSRATLTPR